MTRTGPCSTRWLRRPQTLTFAQQGSLTRTYGDDAFSNAASNNRRDGGSITYASSRESVATVASDGTVTIHAAGEATITATAAETANYQQSAASYTLRVSPKGVTITRPAGGKQDLRRHCRRRHHRHARPLRSDGRG